MGSSMYMVMQNGAHQYRVKPGQFLRVEKLNVSAGETWKCQQILAFQDGKGEFLVGTPYLKKAEILAKVMRHGKGKKTLVFKKKRRKGYRKTKGHRQDFTEIYIETCITPTGQRIEELLSEKNNHTIEDIDDGF